MSHQRFTNIFCKLVLSHLEERFEPLDKRPPVSRASVTKVNQGGFGVRRTRPLKRVESVFLLGVACCWHV